MARCCTRSHSRSISLPDDDLDSGKATVAGEYTLADDTYAKLLSQLAEKKFDATTVPLQKNVLSFLCECLGAESRRRKIPGKWQKVQS